MTQTLEPTKRNRKALKQIRQWPNPKPDDGLNLAEIAHELGCSEERVRALMGKRGGDVVIPFYFGVNGVLLAERRHVDAVNARQKMNGVMRTPTRGRRQ